MSDTPLQRTRRSFTLLVPGKRSEPDPQDAQRYWDPIESAWPQWGCEPLANIRTMPWALSAIGESLGSAVVAYIGADDDQAMVFKLIDHLWEQAIPLVLVFDDLTPARQRLGGRGVLVVPSDATPQSIAATLHALAERQQMIESLRSELRVARRFQGGLRGEIDKIHEELQLAASVQREFLPRTLPQAETVDVQIYFRPAGYVSGDIYDVQKLDEHHLGFFIADAVGHGVPAALMTMVLLRSLTTTAHDAVSKTILPPGEVLENLNNEMIHRHGDVPRFATAAYGIIDTRDRTVTIAGAGHPAPIIVSPDKTRGIETSGGLLGVFPEATFDEAEFTLADDEMLILYSDGFETAFPGESSDEYTRRVPSNRYMHYFRRTADTWRQDNLRSAMDELACKLNSQSGSMHPIDDLTALVLVPARTAPLDRLFREDTGESNRQSKAPAPRPVKSDVSASS